MIVITPLALIIENLYIFCTKNPVCLKKMAQKGLLKGYWCKYALNLNFSLLTQNTL